VRSLIASRLDLGIKRASEERHKRESEHYIVIYISQTKKNGWTSDVSFALPVIQFWMSKEAVKNFARRKWRGFGFFRNSSLNWTTLYNAETSNISVEASHFGNRLREFSASAQLRARFSFFQTTSLNSRLHNAVQLMSE